MQGILFLAALSCFLVSSARANGLTPCTTMTLTQLIQSGGCVDANGVVYSDFSYSHTGQNIPIVPPDAVLVSFSTFGGGGSVTFSSTWTSPPVTDVTQVSLVFALAFPAGTFLSGGFTSTATTLGAGAEGVLNSNVYFAPGNPTGCTGLAWHEADHLGGGGVGWQNETG